MGLRVGDSGILFGPILKRPISSPPPTGNANKAITGGSVLKKIVSGQTSVVLIAAPHLVETLPSSTAPTIPLLICGLIGSGI